MTQEEKAARGKVSKEQAMRFADYYCNGVTNAERGEPEEHWEEFLRDSGDADTTAKVSNCCGAEVSYPPEDQDLEDAGSLWHLYVAHYCLNCEQKCDPVSKEDFLHQKIDSLQMELRDVKSKLATLEGETRTIQKFVKGQEG